MLFWGCSREQQANYLLPDLAPHQFQGPSCSHWKRGLLVQDTTPEDLRAIIPEATPLDRHALLAPTSVDRFFFNWILIFPDWRSVSGINSNVWRRSVTRSQRAHLITEEHPHAITDLKIIEAIVPKRSSTLAHAQVKIGTVGCPTRPFFFAAVVLCS